MYTHTHVHIYPTQVETIQLLLPMQHTATAAHWSTLQHTATHAHIKTIQLPLPLEFFGRTPYRRGVCIRIVLVFEFVYQVVF